MISVDARGHIQWQDYFGPKERRRRQITINAGDVSKQGIGLGLLSALSRPAGTPQNNALGGLLGSFINQAVNQAFVNGASVIQQNSFGQTGFSPAGTPNIGAGELKGIKWSQNIRGSQLVLPPSKAAPGFDMARSYYLGFGNPNFAYQTCFTPTGQTGVCRFLQHCARPEILESLDNFLLYACPIGADYMGVCCAEEGSAAPQQPVSTPAPPPVPSPPPTTQRTTTTTPRPVTAASTPATTGRKGCGDHSEHVNTRIVGGRPADKGEWPWMAALLRDGTDQYCGGVLITDQHVLTASHCTDSFKPNEITVRLGEYDFNEVSDTRRDFAVEKIFMHEGYERKTYTNDISLLKLTQKATFTNFIWPICLPPNSRVLEGQTASVTGWGTTSYSGATSEVLLEVILPIWNGQECKNAYPNQPISEKQMCAGYKAGGKDSCQGDSGGPLMYQMTSGRWAAIGVVSWGIRCAEPGKPGVYTRVAAYSDWIKSKVLSE